MTDRASRGAPGTLAVVATPIGNLADVTERALDALRNADLVLAEDTRVSRKLLARHGIDRRLVSLHRFNEAARLESLVERLARGETLALVSDGGTPALSDPGARLVAAAHAAGARVVPLPGPSAISAALSVAGLPADRFHFEGFLPSRPSARRRRLAELADHSDTLAIFEAPHRLLASLADMIAAFGDRDATLCRELTKRYEEVRAGTLESLRDSLAERDTVRGEIVLVVRGREPAAAARVAGVETSLAARLVAALEHEEGDRGRALRRLARELGIARSELKRRLAGIGL